MIADRGGKEGLSGYKGISHQHKCWCRTGAVAVCYPPLRILAQGLWWRGRGMARVFYMSAVPGCWTASWDHRNMSTTYSSLCATLTYIEDLNPELKGCKSKSKAIFAWPLSAISPQPTPWVQLSSAKPDNWQKCGTGLALLAVCKSTAIHVFTKQLMQTDFCLDFFAPIHFAIPYLICDCPNGWSCPLVWLSQLAFPNCIGKH